MERTDSPQCTRFETVSLRGNPSLDLELVSLSSSLRSPLVTVEPGPRDVDETRGRKNFKKEVRTLTGVRRITLKGETDAIICNEDNECWLLKITIHRENRNFKPPLLTRSVERTSLIYFITCTTTGRPVHDSPTQGRRRNGDTEQITCTVTTT